MTLHIPYYTSRVYNYNISIGSACQAFCNFGHKITGSYPLVEYYTSYIQLK